MIAGPDVGCRTSQTSRRILECPLEDCPEIVMGKTVEEFVR